MSSNQPAEGNKQPLSIMPSKDHYAPMWADPDWQEGGLNRAPLDRHPIKDRVMSRVRPALLAVDQIRNPTEYAKRFGIYPDRIDGRSRTSPTRAESRQIFPKGKIQTGKDLFGRLEKLAAEKGQSLDEFMAKKRIDKTEMRDKDEACMRVYEDLLVDEYWQGLLFGDLTMDELHAEDYFTMGTAESGLQGSLHPFLRRSNWMSDRWAGQAGATTRTVYNINGERGEYNPRSNDRVWEALQPALQLASRLLSADHPFMSAIKDPTNRFCVDDSLDLRLPEEKKKTPRFSFRSFVDINDLRLVPAARLMRQMPHFDPTAVSQMVIENCIELGIQSGHYHFDAEFKEVLAVAETKDQATGPSAPIQISLAAEVVWPLLEPNFSSSEKMMASFVIAISMVHEFMHAWIYAQGRWLHSPQTFGISDPYLQDLCHQLLNELYPGGLNSGTVEPSFEDDPVSEVGHAYEQHVLGGGVWPLAGNMCGRANPPFLRDYTGMAVHVKWPDATPEGWTNSLAYPEIRADQYNHFLRVGDIQKYFKEEFWQNSVKRYGMAAMRVPSKKPHKVFFSRETCRGSSWTLSDSGLEIDVCEWMEKYLDDLSESGKETLETYLRTLISEACNFRLMAKRFVQDKKRRTSTEWPWLHTGKMVLMLAVELRGHAIMLSPNSRQPKLAGLRNEYSRWTKLATSARSLPDKHSEKCRGKFGIFQKSVCGISLDDHNNRLVPRLMDLVNLLETEREIQESMLCELYRLPSKLWKHYKSTFEGQYEFSQSYAKVVLKTLSSIMTIIDEANAFIPSWSDEWRARLQSLATAWNSIQRLLEMDPNNICEDWRDLLVTMPMLRKSQRLASDRLYFLAKKEMLNQTGQDLQDLRKFQHHVQQLVKLESKKIVLLERDLDEQARMHRWDVVLDDVVEEQASDPKLARTFNTKPVHELVAKLKQQKLGTKKIKRDRATVQAARKTKKARQRLQGLTLQQTAGSDAVHAPRTPAQISRPSFTNHAVPFGGLQGTQFGLSSRAPGSVTTNHAFAPQMLNSRIFPSWNEGPAESWVTSDLSQLSAQFNQLGTNKPHGSRTVSGIMTHPFAGQEMEGVKYGQEDQERAAAAQGDVDMDYEDTGVSPCAAFLARPMLGCDESASDSLMTSRSATRASSDTTAVDTNVSTGIQSEEKAKTSGLKRKGSWAGAEAKRARSGK
ncbi:hypothetical protein B0J13DRAFT_634896 [Dactylonectria estremocensis]|uniref:Uncharacterized protein n=1 Tax=Dactylonectria estremocensis TaxID=1079267 RepID=A0A9P9FKV7_9HYPO|nr:hypothetical protein B0J13DRAFT_634896 [Dactylonectria estremocensis]